MNRRARSTVEMQQQLQEQMHLLQSYCYQFDCGDWLAAKPMSVALRVSLHHPDRPKIGQGSLLAQLGLRGGFWLDSTRVVGAPTRSSSQASWPQIMVMQMGGNGPEFQPKIMMQATAFRRTSFIEWWGGEIGSHHQFGPMSRKKLVTGMADQDGGAHVDGNVDSSYDAFTRGNYFNMTIGDKKEFARGATYACIRTIAHETMITVYGYAPKAVVTKYRYLPIGSSEFHSIP